MKKLMLVPALLFAACGDNLHPEQEQVAGVEEGSGSTPDMPDAPNAQFFAFFLEDPGDCADHSVYLEGHWGYVNGPVVENAICHYDFGDGTFADTCRPGHSFPDAQNVTFTATDPATGATASFTESVIGPRSFEAALSVTTDGLSISWDAHGFYGGVDAGSTFIKIEPADKVIAPDPLVFAQPQGTVQVTAAGSYVVTLDTHITFAENGGCTAQADQRVEVICNGDMHAK
jgi:hypothetical protein